jgi:hypothetical protein
LKVQEGNDLTPEYYEAFYKLAMQHPSIFKHIKDELRLKARGSAGGKGKAKAMAALANLPDDGGGEPTEGQEGEGHMEMIIETIQMGGPGIRKEGKYLIVPVHLTQEGVANRGLKRWEEIYDPDEIDGVHSFEGVPITRGHTEEFGGTKPALGRLQNVIVNKKKKWAKCEGKIVAERLTGLELKALKDGEYVPGSIGYQANKKFHPEPQKWDDGEEYEWEVRKPLRGNHYALLEEGDEPACSVCGFNANGKPKESAGSGSMSTIEELMAAPPSLELVDGEVRRKCPKAIAKLKEGENYMDANINFSVDDLRKILKESIDPLVKRVEDLEKMKEMKGEALLPPLAEAPEIKQLTESVKKITEALPDLARIKATEQAAALTATKKAFGSHLKAAYLKEGKPEGEAFEKVFTEASAHQLGRDVYLAEHAEVRIAAIEERQFQGRPGAGGSGGNIVEEARARANAPLREKR